MKDIRLLMPNAQTLKNEHRLKRETEPPALALRIHRALSWLDKAEKRIHQQLWQQFTQAIRVLLDNPYVYQPCWKHHNGIAGYEDWESRFNKAKQAAQISIMKQETAQVLSIVFSRLYTLHNQIIHGGATSQPS